MPYREPRRIGRRGPYGPYALRRWRARKGWTQEEMAADSPVSGSLLGRMERGEVQIRQDVAEHIGRVCGVDWQAVYFTDPDDYDFYTAIRDLLVLIRQLPEDKRRSLQDYVKYLLLAS